jgi:hypothetical protein
MRSYSIIYRGLIKLLQAPAPHSALLLGAVRLSPSLLRIFSPLLQRRVNQSRQAPDIKLDCNGSEALLDQHGNLFNGHGPTVTC